jgi:hypothetical protein
MTHADQNDTSDSLELFNEQTAHMQQYPDQVQTALKEIGDDLTAWYQKAEAAGDAEAMTAITTSWARTEQIALIANEQQEAMIYLATIAQNLKAQRDNAAGQFDKLYEAIKSVDNSHPLVAHIYEQAQEEVYEYYADFEESAPIETTPENEVNADNIIANGHLTGIEADTIERFLDILMDYTDELTDDMYGRLVQFMVEFTQEADEFWAFDHDRKVELYHAANLKRQMEAANGSR